MEWGMVRGLTVLDGDLLEGGDGRPADLPPRRWPRRLLQAEALPAEGLGVGGRHVALGQQAALQQRGRPQLAHLLLPAHAPHDVAGWRAGQVTRDSGQLRHARLLQGVGKCSVQSTGRILPDTCLWSEHSCYYTQAALQKGAARLVPATRGEVGGRRRACPGRQRSPWRSGQGLAAGCGRRAG